MTRLRIEVDGKAFDVELREGKRGPEAVVEGDVFAVRVDAGATTVVRVGPASHTVALHTRSAVLDGIETPYRILEVHGVAGVLGAASDGKVRPPMTGRIEAIPVKAGQSVARGDVLFVLEAMKMRNDVKSPADGTVAKVHAKVGDTVEPGTVVIELAG